MVPRNTVDYDAYYHDDPEYDDPPSSSKGKYVSILLAMAVSLMLIGDTIGALINVNTKSPVEFGQGRVITVACDSDGITVKPIATARKENEDISFYFTALEVSGISDNCLNKQFAFNFYPLMGDAMPVGYYDITANGKSDATTVRILLSRKPSNKFQYQDLLYWNLFNKPGPNNTSLSFTFPNPPSTTDLAVCGVLFNVNAVDLINLNWGENEPVAGCPNSYYLSHIDGYITIPGVDDGNLHDVTFTQKSFGNTELYVGGTKVISDRSIHTSLTEKSGYLSLRRGQTYSIDTWTYKGNSGSAATYLYWNLDSAGEKLQTPILLPSNAFTLVADDAIEIAPSEKITDYSAISTGTDINSRSFRINFVRDIPAGNLKALTVQTS